jgi:hypothetical protein
MRLGWLVFFGVAVATVLVAVGFGLADLGRITVCDGPIVDAVPCHEARLRQSIFAAALALGGIISAAVMIAAFVVARRPRQAAAAADADQPPTGDGVADSSPAAD